MRPYIMKRRGNFVCQSVNQSVYMFTFKQRGLQLRNLIQRYWRGFLKRPQRVFFKKLIQISQNDLKKHFFEFYFKLFFYFIILCIFAWYTRSTVPKFSIQILKRDFEKTLKRFFQKSFQFIYKDSSKCRIFVWVISHVKIYQLSQNLDIFF